ncbi:MAG TPA: 5-dehydro-4-deoxy-D-glucuronate isomerase [Terracidiphilus sp.]|nr:5-dehydro-4-deoxy-D-glucuronate isomerase [Terracidiphilus sp.]
MKIFSIGDPVRYSRMTTTELRETFLLESLCEPGHLRQAYVDLDRAVVGFAAPLTTPLVLAADPLLRASFFNERRELGALSLAGSGSILVDGVSFDLNPLDCLYIGRGAKQVSFASKNPQSPTVFYLLSYPAHASHPTRLIRKDEASPMEVGSKESCNLRTIYKYIHLEGARSCQLVMGVTHMHPGSAWNTMPPHTHMRRSEIYMYFNLSPGARAFHMMGPPDETRHIVMKDCDVVVSPGWSIHAGVGTEAYSFCWGMGGENQDYSDMDPAPLAELR